MPRRFSVPSYRLHKPSGQARVIIHREHIYLGKFGSAESRGKYSRLIAELTAEGGSGKFVVPRCADEPSNSVNAIMLAYWQFANAHYVKNGEPTHELENIRTALRPLRRLYGSTPAKDFGPKRLKALRQHLIETGLCRGVVSNNGADVHRFHHRGPAAAQLCDDDTMGDSFAFGPWSDMVHRHFLR
jgi:hypothetical protein